MAITDLRKHAQSERTEEVQLMSMMPECLYMRDEPLQCERRTSLTGSLTLTGSPTRLLLCFLRSHECRSATSVRK